MVNAGTSDTYVARVRTFAQVLSVITVHIKSWTSSLSQLSGHKCMERVVSRVTSKALLCHCPPLGLYVPVLLLALLGRRRTPDEWLPQSTSSRPAGLPWRKLEPYLARNLA